MNSKKSSVILKILGDIIKEKRMSLNKTQRLFADEYEIQRSLISRIERGENEPKLISIMTICEALEIKPSELMCELEQRLPMDFHLIEQ